MHTIEKIIIPELPPANTTYSQAVRVGDFLFVSGQTGMDYQTGKMVGADITSQTRQLFENTRRILEAAGASFDRLVRVMIYITDKDDLGKMNEVYAQYVTTQPAKALAVVAFLFGGAKVEMEFIAAL